MTTVKVMSEGASHADSVDALLKRPDFRKATLNMALACDAVRAVEAKLGDGWFKTRGDRTALVLGTAHGELEATTIFLRGLGQDGTARPFIFQNSLHNATMGFVSQRFGLRGPGVTVSNGDSSGPDAIETGLDLLEEPTIDFVLVVAVERPKPNLSEPPLAQARAVLYAKRDLPPDNIA
jgi:3-oxoacyl-(acyl-carrier-protein) synthase